MTRTPTLAAALTGAALGALGALALASPAQAAPAYWYYHHNLVQNPGADDGTTGWTTGSTGTLWTGAAASPLTFASYTGSQMVYGWTTNDALGPVDPVMEGGSVGGDPPLSTDVPEPASTALGLAGAGAALAARRRGRA
jgi:hypothetical protein